jgi:2-polyprenyl-3-methyl-5-hydroxy-6-metoxy-1,4-benzoquinol methylase
MTTDPKEIVRRGYDALSHHYRGDDTPEGHYHPWIAELRRRIQLNGTVLDLGCGCGVPLARSLANTGYTVTGVDLSDVQIRRARQLVPGATFFIRADATTADFPTASFDAVVCLYALIHMPLDEQPPLVARIATWLKPSGWFLATGHQAWTGTEDNWLGGTATMWWSHADTATYRSWITHAGLVIQAEDFTLPSPPQQLNTRQLITSVIPVPQRPIPGVGCGAGAGGRPIRVLRDRDRASPAVNPRCPRGVR